jgi:hypothetical protein
MKMILIFFNQASVGNFISPGTKVNGIIENM